MSPRERAEIHEALAAHERWEDARTFRAFLQSNHYCGLDPSPMVTAIADAADGTRPTTIDDATSERYFGCALDALPTTAPRCIALEAGGRGGKTSRLLAPKALHAAWTVPLPTLFANEHAVALIVSSELVFARQALRFCVGHIQRSPVLRSSLVGEPGTDSLTLLRPDGHLVDVQVRAAGARGKGGRAFTLCFAGFDEACFFYDDSGVVNDREIYRACAPRVVPGGQLWMVSTPWIEGVGILEEKLAANWGRHEEALAIRGVGTKALNPSWDPDGSIEAEERKNDPENASREIDAVPLTAGTRHFFSREAIEASIREHQPQEIPYRAGSFYGVGGDAGFVKNSSALAIVERIEMDDGAMPPHFRLVRLEERKPLPGLPLKGKAVAQEFADIFLGYHVHEMVADAHELDEVAEALLEKGCTVVLAPEKTRAYVEAKTILHEGRFAMPLHPRLRQQLRDVMAKPMPGGGTQITSPKRPDGSHGDLVSALVNALWAASLGPRPAPAPPPPVHIPTPWADAHGF